MRAWTQAQLQRHMQEVDDLASALNRLCSQMDGIAHWVSIIDEPAARRLRAHVREARTIVTGLEHVRRGLDSLPRDELLEDTLVTSPGGEAKKDREG